MDVLILNRAKPQAHCHTPIHLILTTSLDDCSELAVHIYLLKQIFMTSVLHFISFVIKIFFQFLQ